MEKPKFEFEKLELPKPVSSSENYHLIKNDGTFMDSNVISTKKHKLFPFVYLIPFTIIGLVAGYYARELNNTDWKFTINGKISPKVEQLVLNSTKNTVNHLDSAKKITVKKPIYFNYYDSIIFLNDVKGSKIVVSKGYDDYIKKDKIIVKSDGYYYNIFCKDLYHNYAVGDSIP